MDLDSITHHQYIEKHRLLQPETTCEALKITCVKNLTFKEKYTGPKEMFTRRESVKESSTERVLIPCPPSKNCLVTIPPQKAETAVINDLACAEVGQALND